MRERTVAALEAARARGRVGGRPSVMTPVKMKIARQLYDAKELTVEEIARTLGVSRKTIYRHLVEAGSS
jgi:DNA invertase Pin-like site-specific DNA recombinase